MLTHDIVLSALVQQAALAILDPRLTDRPDKKQPIVELLLWAHRPTQNGGGDDSVRDRRDEIEAALLGAVGRIIGEVNARNRLYGPALYSLRLVTAKVLLDEYLTAGTLPPNALSAFISNGEYGYNQRVSFSVAHCQEVVRSVPFDLLSALGRTEWPLSVCSLVMQSGVTASEVRDRWRRGETFDPDALSALVALQKSG